MHCKVTSYDLHLDWRNEWYEAGSPSQRALPQMEKSADGCSHRGFTYVIITNPHNLQFMRRYKNFTDEETAAEKS